MFWQYWQSHASLYTSILRNNWLAINIFALFRDNIHAIHILQIVFYLKMNTQLIKDFSNNEKIIESFNIYPTKLLTKHKAILLYKIIMSHQTPPKRNNRF